MLLLKKACSRMNIPLAQLLQEFADSLILFLPETTTYRCTHCSTEFESRGTAEQHVESKECVKNLLCQLCGDTFTSDTLLEKHSCKGKPRYY